MGADGDRWPNRSSPHQLIRRLNETHFCHGLLKGDSEGTSPENESSVIQLAEICGEKILLTGDAGVGGLNEAHAYATEMGVDLTSPINRFDVPHHGSRRNMSSDVLDTWFGPILEQKAEPPRFTAVISANSNDEDHPRKAVVRALIHRGAKVLQTTGTVCCHHDGPDRGEGWSPAKPLTYPADTEE